MKPVVVTALALLLLLFLWPMVFLGGPAPAPEKSESLPTATLPIDRASVRPAEEWAGKSAGETVVRVKQADGTVTALSMADYPVSYTHLDVYKRQAERGDHARGALVRPILPAICRGDGAAAVSRH